MIPIPSMYDIFTYISHKNPPFMDRQIYKSSHGSFGISCEENNPTSSNRIRWAEDVMLPIVGQIFIAVRCLYMTRLGEFFSPRLKIPVEIWESCIDKNSWSFLLVSKNLTLDVKHEFQNKSQCFPATSSPLQSKFRLNKPYESSLWFLIDSHAHYLEDHPS